MTYRLPPLNALRAFEAAARHLSFKKAADELAVTPTAISHQLRGLEDYLGCPLFRRLTRALELTEEGRAMLPKVREGLACFAAAVESTRLQETSGRLAIASPPAFAARWLIPQLPGFSNRHPEVQLHLSTTVRTIDSRDAVGSSGLEGLDVRDDETPVFIRFGRGQYSGCRVDRLFSPVYTAVCSPHLKLHSLNDLRRQILLHDDTIPELMDRPTWREWLQEAGVGGIDPDAGMHFSDPGLVLSAAIDGVGVALASKPLVRAEVVAGRLRTPFDIVIRRPQAYFLVVPEAVADRPIVRAFREWLLEEAAKVFIVPGDAIPNKAET
jgi:LysR family transcriptional regulator, glycine cleavage system transcriptional activator